MKILVTAKRVEDPESKIKVKADGSGIVQEGLKYKMNPFDEIAVEEGLRLVAKHGGDVVVVSIGPKDVQEQLRHALAMGATACGVGQPRQARSTPWAQPPCFKRWPRRRSRTSAFSASSPSTTTKGRPVSTWRSGSDGAQATFASKLDSLESEAEKAKAPALELSADGKTIQVVREVDSGLSTLACTLPAVVTTDLRLNQPRYASLPGIMKAKSKPMEELTPQALGVEVGLQVEVLRLTPPPPRKAGVKVGDVQELFQKLKNEAKVL